MSFRYYKEIEIPLRKIMQQLDEELRVLHQPNTMNRFYKVAENFLAEVRGVIEAWNNELMNLEDYFKLYEIMEAETK